MFMGLFLLLLNQSQCSALWHDPVQGGGACVCVGGWGSGGGHERPDCGEMYELQLHQRCLLAISATVSPQSAVCYFSLSESTDHRRVLCYFQGCYNEPPLFSVCILSLYLHGSLEVD